VAAPRHAFLFRQKDFEFWRRAFLAQHQIGRRDLASRMALRREPFLKAAWISQSRRERRAGRAGCNRF
jgi:hypothetical protein